MTTNPLSSTENDLPDSYLTLGGTAEGELKVQRSRFIGLACPIDTDETAGARLGDFRRRFHDARHVCYGYRLGLGGDSLTRRNDDGEPSGTAGEPIIKAIDRCALTDVLVVVVRYFGGVKLGTGGLARAYGQAADLALEKAERREVLLGLFFTLKFTYAQEKTIRHLLENHAGRVQDQEYGAEVTWNIWLPHSRWRNFAKRLADMTAGTVSLNERDTPKQ